MIIPNRPRALRFLARRRPGLILIGLAAAATTAAVPVSASASTVASPVVGYTYVNGNTAPANTVDGFARHADGSLTPLAGSPFSAGGAGLGAGLASQGAIQVTSDRKYLLAVDAGSNQISVLRIAGGGVPVLAGHPVPSGGITPVSVAVSPFGLVYVANQGNGGSGYSGFRLHSGGGLTPVAGSTVTTAPASVRSPPTRTPFPVISPPSDPRPSLTGRPHRAGWRSVTTASTSSPSTPARATSPATRSSGTAPSS